MVLQRPDGTAVSATTDTRRSLPPPSPGCHGDTAAAAPCRWPRSRGLRERTGGAGVTRLFSFQALGQGFSKGSAEATTGAPIGARHLGDGRTRGAGAITPQDRHHQGLALTGSGAERAGLGHLDHPDLVRHRRMDRPPGAGHAVAAEGSSRPASRNPLRTSSTPARTKVMRTGEVSLRMQPGRDTKAIVADRALAANRRAQPSNQNIHLHRPLCWAWPERACPAPAQQPLEQSERAVEIDEANSRTRRVLRVVGRARLTDQATLPLSVHRSPATQHPTENVGARRRKTRRGDDIRSRSGSASAQLHSRRRLRADANIRVVGDSRLPPQVRHFAGLAHPRRRETPDCSVLKQPPETKEYSPAPSFRRWHHGPTRQGASSGSGRPRDRVTESHGERVQSGVTLSRRRAVDVVANDRTTKDGPVMARTLVRPPLDRRASNQACVRGALAHPELRAPRAEAAGRPQPHALAAAAGGAPCRRDDDYPGAAVGRRAARPITSRGLTSRNRRAGARDAAAARLAVPRGQQHDRSSPRRADAPALPVADRPRRRRTPG